MLAGNARGFFHSAKFRGGLYVLRKFSGTLKNLNGKIIYTLNNLADKAKIDVPHFHENLYNIVLCGNSTMQHPS